MRDPTNRTAGRPAKFGKEDILEAALEVLDTEGYEALSMRAIAKRLGTGAASLYNHFGSLAELDDAIAASLLKTLSIPKSRSPRRLKKELVNLAIAYYELLVRLPKLNAMIGQRSRIATLALIDSILSSLVSAGAEIERAGLAYAVMRGLAQDHANVITNTFNQQRIGDSTESITAALGNEYPTFQKYLKSKMFAKTPKKTYENAINMTLDLLLPELMHDGIDGEFQ